MTHRRVVLVLGLATMISTASPNQGKIYGNSAFYVDGFRKKYTYETEITYITANAFSYNFIPPLLCDY